jgi:hypothetical protein
MRHPTPSLPPIHKPRKLFFLPDSLKSESVFTGYPRDRRDPSHTAEGCRIRIRFADIESDRDFGKQRKLPNDPSKLLKTENRAPEREIIFGKTRSRRSRSAQGLLWKAAVEGFTLTVPRARCIGRMRRPPPSLQLHQLPSGPPPPRRILQKDAESESFRRQRERSGGRQPTKTTKRSQQIVENRELGARERNYLRKNPQSPSRSARRLCRKAAVGSFTLTAPRARCGIPVCGHAAPGHRTVSRQAAAAKSPLPVRYHSCTQSSRGFLGFLQRTRKGDITSEWKKL